MKIAGSGVAQQQDIQKSGAERKATSGAFESFLGDRVARPMQSAEWSRVSSENTMPSFNVVSAQGTKVLDQGEISFFENMLYPVGNAKGSMQDRLQSAIRLNRLA